ncbi:TPA: hypothetical protein OTS28_004026 [Klebsiella pneumoniae]|nr:hypothetical protein [Klebsiella pneumoniae]
MKSVLTALSGMGKSSCTEIAARLGKDVRDMLKILQSMQDQGKVSFLNGYWSLAGGTAPQHAAPADTVVKASRPKLNNGKSTGLREQVLALLKSTDRALDTAEITTELGRTVNSLNGILGKLAADGLITKQMDGRILTWTVPREAAQAEPAVTPAEKTVSEIVSEIPTFTSRPTDLIVPTAAGISRELRRARARVASLEKLRDTTREIRRYAKLLQELAE